MNHLPFLSATIRSTTRLRRRPVAGAIRGVLAGAAVWAIVGLLAFGLLWGGK